MTLLLLQWRQPTMVGNRRLTWKIHWHSRIGRLYLDSLAVERLGLERWYGIPFKFTSFLLYWITSANSRHYDTWEVLTGLCEQQWQTWNLSLDAGHCDRVGVT